MRGAEHVWDVENQILHLFRYFGTFGVLFYLLPKLLFVRPQGDGLERGAALFLKMVLLVIVSGYALVLLKLFEVLSLAAVYGLIIAHRIGKRQAALHQQRASNLTLSALDFLEGKLPLKERLSASIRGKAGEWKEAAKRRFRSLPGLWLIVLLVVVFGVSSYIRMYDAVTSAPPALSDGNVTLEWMKYIDDRKLFAGGVYPQGFHIYLDTIHKFASIDSLYVLKYTGPFNMLLVMAGMYFYISRLSGNRVAGVAAAAVFGLLGGQFGGPFERQAATNSQEFAFVFVLPTLYFLQRFLKGRRRDDLVVAGAGMAVTGLVHAVAFGYLGVGVAMTLAYFLLAEGKNSWKPIFQVCLAGIASVFAAVAPIGIGLYLLGREFHTSSVDYLTSESDGSGFAGGPWINDIDRAALAALAVIGLALLVRIRKLRDMSAYGVVFLLGAATFVLYQWGGAFTNSLVVATRSVELWALLVPVCIGMAFQLLLQPVLEKRVKLQLAMLTAAITALLAFFPPQPIDPYKMTWNSAVEQYLRISGEYLPRMWMIVSKEDDYAFISGSGFHLYMWKLIAEYDPAKPHLTPYGKEEPDKNVAQDVFLYVEKQIFEVSEMNSIYPLKKADYERWREEARQVQKWVDRHQEAGHPVEVYYEDNQLLVYHLHREPTRDEIMDRIWGS